MARFDDDQQVAATLAELRPTPSPSFERELDELVAAGFPGRSGGSRFAAFSVRFRKVQPRRLALATGGCALVAIVAATALVASNDPTRAPIALESPTARPSEGAGVQYSDAIQAVPSSEGRAARSAASAEPLSGEMLQPLRSDTSSLGSHRDIERSAEIVLLAEPDDVARDSSEVFRAVHDANGIVLRSMTASGRNAGARFELLIPSAKLSDTLASFSAIDEVRSRHEATDDITTPTVDVTEHLRDSRARIDGLLVQLTSAETESEQRAIEAELRAERQQAAQLQAQLERLQRRADYSRVSLRIEAGSSTPDSGGAWGIGDALDDSGRILGIAAGVTLVALAVIAPIALLALLAWLLHRAWLGGARRRALSQ
jgi:hypothetical protein